MSAFVVDTRTMRRAVEALCTSGQYGQIVREIGGVNTLLPDAATQIGRKLFAMNVEAVSQRYPTDNSVDAEGLPLCFVASEARTAPVTPGGGRARLIAGIKALACLRDQCSQRNVRESDLFKGLDAAIGTLSFYLVTQMPEYEAAPWD